MSDKMREALPTITEADRSFLHYNPNTDDLVDWVQEYAMKAVQAAQSIPMECCGQPVEGNEYMGQVQLVCCGNPEPAGVAASVPVVGEVAGQPHALKQTDLRLGNSSAGWIGCHTDDGKVFVDATELERLRKDAERYRWVRDANNDPGGVIDKIPHPGLSLYRAESELDHAIDAAIAAEGEK